MSRKKTKAKNSAKGANIGVLKEKIFKLLDTNISQAFSVKQLIAKLGLRDKKSKMALTQAVEELKGRGAVQKLRNGGIKSIKEAEEITGTVDFVNPRFAYIVSAQSEHDVKVHAKDLKYALDGDVVKVKVFHVGDDQRPEGEVVEIVSRTRNQFVGRIELSPRFAFVVADNKKMHYDIFVPLEALLGAQHNDKVLVKITEWPGRDRNPTGEVVKVLGKAGEHHAEMHSIMAEFGLPFEFPQEVVREAEQIPEEITNEEIKKRRDMRQVTTFTIDPEDAKDFDDALSIRKLENGNYEIGVHIADVSHYMQPGSLLDKEAIHRATSVYLVDRTIPMLPERLSNGLCSLRPHEDKLTFSVVFEMDEEANVLSEWFGRTVTHSDRRFAYEEAQERIETKQGDFAEEINTLNGLAKKLKAARFKNGSINFETVEVKFKLDENGKPLGVYPKVRKDAHMLIEDFMLLANKRVAEFISKMKKGQDKNTFVYRIHDYPDPEKLLTFSVFAQKFGHKLKIDDANIATSLNALISEIEGRPEQNVLSSLAIRTMAKAKYTTEDRGHFGLAFPHYTHFTSPIRRYPDVMVHRLLQHYLDKGKSVNKEVYEELCVHSSEMEKRAADAERASIKYKQVEFMASVEDKIFDGIISGVTEWGIYVEIVETKCEGMVRMADLTDDFYEYDDKNYRIIGKRYKKIYTLGDKVRVSVKKTDIDRRTIDLELED
jgi:ribonuclease R